MDNVSLLVEERHDVPEFEIGFNDEIILFERLDGDGGVHETVIGIRQEEVEGCPQAVDNRRPIPFPGR